MTDTNGTERREKAILVGVVIPPATYADVEDSMNELTLLADTAGADIVERLVQGLDKPIPATYIGSGKVKELESLVAQHEADLVIFDDDLSPVQMRNLERSVKCKLLDRTALILDIFAGRARTATAMTQVELAQLDYLRTRLTRQWTHLSRQSGGIGTKGPGETQIETDRRLIGLRMATLRDRLEKIDRQRATQRKGRERFTRVSLVGYTNAGKSTLMNVLADTDVLAENRLFATLDSTTRLVQIGSAQKILLSDTVGFIRKLPHRLIESFKSTLDEVRESDVLLHVVDAGHPRFRDHIQVVQETLKELDAGEKPTLLVFNKVDTFEDHTVLAGLREAYPEAAFVSALRGIGLSDLQARILTVLEEDFIDHEALIPVEDAGAIAYIHRTSRVLEQDYAEARDPLEEEDVLVAFMRFRTPRRFDRDVTGLIASYGHLRTRPE